MNLKVSSDAEDETEHPISDIFFDVRRSFGSSIAFGEDEDPHHSLEDPKTRNQNVQLETLYDHDPESNYAAHSDDVQPAHSGM